jgi:signal transduction histidine kinase/HAMP domain-containing protein
MRRFLEARIARKLSLTPSIALLGLAVLALAAFVTLHDLGGAVDYLNNVSFGRVEAAARLEAALDRANAVTYETMAYAANSNDATALANRVKALRERFDEAEIARQQLTGITDSKTVEPVTEAFLAWKKSILEATTMLDADPASALAFMMPAASNFDKVENALKQISRDTNLARVDTFNEARQKIEVTTLGSAAFVALIAVIVAIATAMTGRAITRPVLDLAAAMARLARQQLDLDIPGIERRDEIGEMAQAVQVFRDALVARKGSDDALHLSQQHLARAQRIARIGSIERDLKSGVERWSDEMYSIVGVEPGTLAPDRSELLAFAHETDAPRMGKAIELAKAGKRLRPGEIRIIRPDGTTRLLYTDAEASHDAAGRKILLTIFKDVTEERAAEELHRATERQLLHSQRLEALGTLAGGAAHEINNALVPVMALTKMVASHLPEDSRDRRSLRTVLAGAERSRDLVSQILAFARKEESAQRRESVDVAAVLHVALQLMRATVPTSIRLEEEIAAVPPVLGDPTQLHQVVVNLVTNAAQAIGEAHGTITVGLRLDTARAALRLWVADSGCGMDAATQARVFEPFFTTKEVGKGTGLGLSVVHGIVKDHGGRIEIESAPGKGTRFDIILPHPLAAPGEAGDEHKLGQQARDIESLPFKRRTGSS